MYTQAVVIITYIQIGIVDCNFGCWTQLYSISWNNDNKILEEIEDYNERKSN